METITRVPFHNRATFDLTKFAVESPMEIRASNERAIKRMEPILDRLIANIGHERRMMSYKEALDRELSLNLARLDRTFPNMEITGTSRVLYEQRRGSVLSDHAKKEQGIKDGLNESIKDWSFDNAELETSVLILKSSSSDHLVNDLKYLAWQNHVRVVQTFLQNGNSPEVLDTKALRYLRVDRLTLMPSLPNVSNKKSTGSGTNTNRRNEIRFIRNAKYLLFLGFKYEDIENCAKYLCDKAIGIDTPNDSFELSINEFPNGGKMKEFLDKLNARWVSLKANQGYTNFVKRVSILQKDTNFAVNSQSFKNFVAGGDVRLFMESILNASKDSLATGARSYIKSCYKLRKDFNVLAKTEKQVKRAFVIRDNRTSIDQVLKSLLSELKAELVETRKRLSFLESEYFHSLYNPEGMDGCLFLYQVNELINKPKEVRDTINSVRESISIFNTVERRSIATHRDYGKIVSTLLMDVDRNSYKATGVTAKLVANTLLTKF